VTVRGPPAAAFALLGLVLSACSATSSTGARSASGRTPSPSHKTGTAHGPVPATASAAASARLRIAVAGALPHGLSRTVAVAVGGEIVLLGGLVAGDTTTAAVLRFNPQTGRTTTAGRLAAAVHDASGASLGGRAVVFGGGAATSVADIQAWQGGTGTVTGRLSRGRSDSGAAVVGSTAYVVGGFDGTGLVKAVEAPADGVHVRTAGTLALGVRYPAVGAAGGAVWIIGGQLATTESTRTGGQTDDIQRFDPATGRTTVAGHLPILLGHATAFTLGGVLYVAGGRTGNTAARTVWRLDPRTGRVSPVGVLPVACSDMAAVVIGNTAWLVGGETTGPTAPIRTVVSISAS
jgi:N-acetylneuraminic acid mutarotase